MAFEPWKKVLSEQRVQEREQRNQQNYDKLWVMYQESTGALKLAYSRIQELEGEASDFANGRKAPRRTKPAVKTTGGSQAAEGGGYAAVSDMAYDGIVTVSIWSWGKIAAEAFSELAILSWGLHALLGTVITWLYRRIRWAKGKK